MCFLFSIVAVHGAPSTTQATPAAMGGDGGAWCKLKFNFTVNCLGATLYSGDSNLVCG